MRYDIRKLQNGRDIIGIASEAAGEEINFIQNNAGAITTAYMVWLAQKLDKPIFTLKICVGSDDRPSSQELKEGVMMGVQMTGSRNYDAGLATTAAVFMSQVMPAYEFDGAVMVTAGNLPDHYNGLKFFTADGPIEEEDLKGIVDKAFKYAFIGEWFECEPVNVMQMYAAHLRGIISAGLGGGGNNLSGMNFSVDTSNAAGEFFATEVLAKLGATVNADGQNDLAIALGTDASQCIVKDADGNEIDYKELVPQEREYELIDDGAYLAAQIIIALVKQK